MDCDLTPAAMDYLMALRLTGEQVRVCLTAIARRLGVSAPSACVMLQNLAGKGLVDSKPRQGVQLTASGVLLTRRIFRRHALIEVFLERLGLLDWWELHGEATRLQYAISTIVEDRIASRFGQSLTSPYGHAIPDETLAVTEPHFQPLSRIHVGQRWDVQQVEDDDPGRLRLWHSSGLVPGATVELVRLRVEDGTYWLKIDDDLKWVESDRLHGVWGEPIQTAAFTR